MNNTFELKSVWKGTDFWSKEIEKAGVLSKVGFFTDVVVEKASPHPESGYGAPVLVDVILDGQKTDVYHSDSNPNYKMSRLFLHIKE